MLASPLTWLTNEGTLKKEALLMAACVECEAEFDIDEPEVGEIVACPECGLEMEIVSVRPLELEAVVEEEEEEEEAEEEDDWSE